MNIAAGRMKMEIRASAAGLVLWLFSAQILAGGTGPATPMAAPETMPIATSTPTPSSADYQKGLAAYDAGDYAKAMSIWLPLAEKGDVPAQRGVGKLYEKGRGVDRDFAKAIRWYRPAAEKGDAESQYRLSVGYGYGLGIKKDEATAMMWLRKAAEGGQKRAQKSLAQGYQDGLFGLPHDPEKAKYWYDKANSGS